MQKYGTDPELDKLVDSNSHSNRIKAAEQGYGFDKLINDKDWHVREACIESDAWSEFVANNWKTLVNHESRYVRIAVAEHGYGFDTLIYDGYWEVRETVAEQGYGLNILIDDKDWHVRQACIESDAWPEFCANNWKKLVYHKSYIIRIAVVRLGYGLNMLINDVYHEVCEAVLDYLDENNYKSINDWIEENPDKVHH